MYTDRPPRTKSLLAKFIESDRLISLELPADDRLRSSALAIEAAMKTETRSAVQSACVEFFRVASAFYAVQNPGVKALAARPLRVREGSTTELFGDYTPGTCVIRLWTRTAIKKQVTSFGTFFSTLCHEFCHHLDCERLGFRRTPHTRGFYTRTAVLYHHACGTPMKPLYWVRMPGEQWRIDWQRMRAAKEEASEPGEDKHIAAENDAVSRNDSGKAASGSSR